jgi:hypothetical protein
MAQSQYQHFRGRGRCLYRIHHHARVGSADGAPLHDWVGLAQRLLILVILFPCRIVLAIRLLHVTEDGDGR